MRRAPHTILLLLLLAGCPTPDDDDSVSSLCNGERDLGEFTADDTFDADGDGYFDPSDPGCAATYSADQLDCDEADSLVNPGATELTCNDKDDDCDSGTADSSDEDGDGWTDCAGDCEDGDEDINPGEDDVPCNGIDEDCDGSDGEPCGTDYSGTWTLADDVEYSCGGGAVRVGFGSIGIAQDHEEVTVTPSNCGDCTGPSSLAGSFVSANQFTAEQVQDAGSGCEKRFSMLATFTSDDALGGSLAVNFVGADCSGMGCSGQNLAFSGTRD